MAVARPRADWRFGTARAASPFKDPRRACRWRTNLDATAPTHGRLTLGLYNCYDPGRWHEIMGRTVARAAPVALAFGCSLATFGFPYDEGRRRLAKPRPSVDLRNAVEVAAFVTASTSIGDDGAILQGLAQEGRFLVHPFPRDGHWPPGLGQPVATTPQPSSGKALDPLGTAALLAGGHDLLLLFGLGPRGLPDAVLAGARLHCELTGRGIPFETATALGALPAMVWTHLQHLGATPGRPGRGQA